MCDVARQQQQPNYLKIHSKSQPNCCNMTSKIKNFILIVLISILTHLSCLFRCSRLTLTLVQITFNFDFFVSFSCWVKFFIINDLNTIVEHVKDTQKCTLAIGDNGRYTKERFLFLMQFALNLYFFMLHNIHACIVYAYMWVCVRRLCAAAAAA